MNIHEYQAKEILRKYGVPTPRGYACHSPAEAVQAAERIGGQKWMVKAQIHAGGRGKAGGVKLADSVTRVREFASRMLGTTLITQQTGPEGRMVRRVLVEEGVAIRKEFYLGMVVDRDSQRVALVASGEGGRDINEVAGHMPDKICRVLIDPDGGLKDSEADHAARRIGIPDEALPQARVFMQNLYRVFDECDATLAEINPMVLAMDGRLLALDARFGFDANALFRHPDIIALRNVDEEDPTEIEAGKFGLTCIAQDGNIGCVVNGAALGMATLDVIRIYGGAPANLLDVDGDTTAGKVTEAFKLMLRNPRIEAILVNIFGGIMQCDVVATGIVEAARQLGLRVPLVVRMKGTNEDQGRRILAESGLPVIAAHSMTEAAKKAVSAARGEPLRPATESGKNLKT